MMAEAIKAYKDECLTGLTEEELKAIRKEIKDYLDSLPKGTKPDANALRKFINSLLKKYGFKGRFDDTENALMAKIIHGQDDLTERAQNVQVAYEKLGSNQIKCTAGSKEASTSTQDTQNEKDNDQIFNKIIVNADGTKSLLIMRNTEVISTMKIGSSNPLLDFLCKNSSEDIHQMCALQ